MGMAKAAWKRPETERRRKAVISALMFAHQCSDVQSELRSDGKLKHAPPMRRKRLLHRVRLILGRLNASNSARDMNLPGLDLHELRGSRKGT